MCFDSTTEVLLLLIIVIINYYFENATPIITDLHCIIVLYNM